MIEATPDEQLELFQVHPRNEKYFLNHDFGDRFEGEICSCGHPSFLHASYCMLIAACGCEKVKPVLHSKDVRAFFQVTHGPMESHALAKGMRLSGNLNIGMEGKLHCKNWCKNYLTIGACRHGRTGASVQVKKLITERHVIYCNNCFEDICFPKEKMNI